MQDHDRALIVGETSFGKGLVQSIIPLESGGGTDSDFSEVLHACWSLDSARLFRGWVLRLLHSWRLETPGPKPGETKPTGPEKKTDTGRAVYEGGGISPDESVKAQDDHHGTTALAQSLLCFCARIGEWARDWDN